MDYEKKYKELEGKIKKAYLYAQTDSTKAVLEDILPELAESEDERVRKALLNEFIHLQSKGYKFAGLEGEEIIAWLVKQGSVEEIVERCKNSWYNEGKIAGMAEGLTDDEKYQQGWHDAIEKQGEQWKPSEEQMIALRQAISGCSYDIEPLVKLETKLKRIMYGYFYKAGKSWEDVKLWEATKNNTQQDINVESFLNQDNYWNIGSFKELAKEMQLVLKADYSYPIIIDEEYKLVDGAHRLVHAYIDGKTHIKGVIIRDDQWPEPDYDELKEIKNK